MTPEEAARLREPFPPSAIGHLPKGGVLLDYVGHAATTDRLLQVDPEWSWEPMSLDERGLPALDADGNLWIRITICGVTRPAVGDGKNMKERIGDAIRNGAMRFGVALDLWAKEDLSEGDGSVVSLGDRQRERVRAAVEEERYPPAQIEEERYPLVDDGSAEAHPEQVITQPQRRRLFAVAREHGVGEDHLRDLLLGMTGTESTAELTVAKYEEIVAFIESRSVHS
jgi:hypothetical protein